MFDGKNSKKIEFLEEERLKIWQRIEAIERELKERPSDIEKEARAASKKAAEYRNKTEDRFNQATEFIGSIQKIKVEVESISNEVVNIKNQVAANLTTSNESSAEIIIQSKELIAAIEKITNIFEEHPDLKSEVNELEETIKSLEENASKANTTYKGILTKKSEIDELHREIIGYEDEGEDGETVPIEGLKGELETAYNTLEGQSEELEKRLEELKKLSKEQYDKFIKDNEDELKNIKDESTNEYDSIKKRIASLLPDAMTAGLSAAFIAKKKEEEKIYEEYKTKFNRGILYLSLVSLLPIAISIYFLSTGVPLQEVVARSPKIILSFMPLYIPLIWTTISANKKVNLSKRLIEEYSHKQVLSMTIEGLSNQIENIEDSAISEELRVQLLRSFLLVTSENPGKLISNYQKSDNPFINIFDLEKSKREESQREKSIVKTVEERTKSIIEKAADEVEDGIVNTVKNSVNE